MQAFLGRQDMRALHMIIKLFWSLFTKCIQRLEFGPYERLVRRVISSVKCWGVMYVHVQRVVLGVRSHEDFQFGGRMRLVRKIVTNVRLHLLVDRVAMHVFRYWVPRRLYDYRVVEWAHLLLVRNSFRLFIFDSGRRHFCFPQVFIPRISIIQSLHISLRYLTFLMHRPRIAIPLFRPEQVTVHQPWIKFILGLDFHRLVSLRQHFLHLLLSKWTVWTHLQCCGQFSLFVLDQDLLVQVLEWRCFLRQHFAQLYWNV